MDVLEWVKVILRWTHVFAAILWIGNTYLFNFMEKSLVDGKMYMVHGGGFYNVEKTPPAKEVPGTLHWFKWEAAATWISGALLISLVYYHGGLLVEPEMSFSSGVIAGVVTIFGGWVVYDLLVTSPLGDNELALAVVGWLALVAITYVLNGYLAPRAVYIHVGGLIGTIMAANVWMRILPSQTKMLEAVKAGKDPGKATSATGPLRSKQNSYLVVPLVFLMISNHYPTIHGSPYNWAYLGGLLIAGWIVARWFRGATKAGEGAPVKSKAPAWRAAAGLGLLVVGVGAAHAYTPDGAATPDGPSTTSGGSGAVTPPAPRPTGTKPAPTGDGKLTGHVVFAGALPPPGDWGGARHAECKPLNQAEQQLVRVADGKLRDVFVYIKDGLPAGLYDAPEKPLVFNQEGCEFEPRVFGVMVGQPIQVGNSDRLMHNVKSPEFNQGFPFGSKRNVELEEPGVMVTIKCDVHPWMRAYAGVMEHPYFATTGDDGAFEIGGLVPGEYTVASWHEKLGALEQKVNVDKTATLTFTYESGT